MAEYGRGRVIGPGDYWPRHRSRKKMLRNQYVEYALLTGKRVCMAGPQGMLYAQLRGNYTEVEFVPHEAHGLMMTSVVFDEVVDTP